MNRKWRILTAATITVALLGCLGWFWLRPRVRYEIVRARLAAELSFSDPAVRGNAAWRWVDDPHPDIETRLTAGLMGDENDAAVRESFANALGRHGAKSSLPALRFAIEHDVAGSVRAAAWLAIARINPLEFEIQSRQHSADVSDPWDELGLAQGALECKDYSRVPALLKFAGHGEENLQRIVASRAIFKKIRPLMDSIGRWPIEATQHEGEPLPTALADEIARRCAIIDMPRIAADNARHYVSGEQIKHTVRRLTGGRERIARLLGTTSNLPADSGDDD